MRRRVRRGAAVRLLGEQPVAAASAAAGERDRPSLERLGGRERRAEGAARGQRAGPVARPLVEGALVACAGRSLKAPAPRPHTGAGGPAGGGVG